LVITAITYLEKPYKFHNFLLLAKFQTFLHK
jgi:hypothetical protein